MWFYLRVLKEHSSTVHLSLHVPSCHNPGTPAQSQRALFQDANSPYNCSIHSEMTLFLMLKSLIDLRKKTFRYNPFLWISAISLCYDYEQKFHKSQTKNDQSTKTQLLNSLLNYRRKFRLATLCLAKKRMEIQIQKKSHYEEQSAS